MWSTPGSLIMRRSARAFAVVAVPGRAGSVGLPAAGDRTLTAGRASSAGQRALMVRTRPAPAASNPATTPTPSPIVMAITHA